MHITMDVPLPKKTKLLFVVFGVLIIANIIILFFDTLVKRDFTIENDLEVDTYTEV